MSSPPHPMQPAPSCGGPTHPCNRTTPRTAGGCDCACDRVVWPCDGVVVVCGCVRGHTMRPQSASVPRVTCTAVLAAGRCAAPHIITRTITLRRQTPHRGADRLRGIIPRNVVLHGVWCGYREGRAVRIHVGDVPGDLQQGRPEPRRSWGSCSRELACVVLQALRHRPLPLLMPAR
jgi:hypothetical protein